MLSTADGASAWVIISLMNSTGLEEQSQLTVKVRIKLAT